MKRVKDFIKKNPEPARGTNYVNPGQLGQYSATNQVSESASLNQYLQSRGIDPEHVSTATKIAYAKSALFLKWKRDHMNEDRTVSPSPTQSKLNKLKTSQSSHKEIKTPSGPGVHNEAAKVEDPAVKAWNKRYLLKQLLTYLGITEEKKPKPTALERFRKAAAEREKKHADIEKKSGGMTAAIDRLEKQVNKESFSPISNSLHKIADKERNKDLDKFIKAHKQSKLIPASEDVEQIDELKKSTVFSWLKQQPVVPEKKPGMSKKDHNQRIKIHNKNWNSALDRLEKHLNKEESVVEHDDPWERDQHGKSVGWKAKEADRDIKAMRADVKKYPHGNPNIKIMKASDVVKSAHKTMDKILSKEEVEQIDEISKSTLASYKDKSTASLKNAQANRDAAEHGKHMSKGFADLHKKSDEIAKKRVKGLKGYLQRKVGMKPTSEDVFQDPQAATQTCFDGGNNTDDTSDKKKQMSKSARMIMAFHKKKNMVKEDLYDHEKEDKSVKTYGKKPKFEKAEKDEGGENKPEAAAVLSGGTAMTGSKRDEVEIDPLMRNRPGQPDVTKKDDKKKDGKEEKKKDK